MTLKELVEQIATQIGWQVVEREIYYDTHFVLGGPKGQEIGLWYMPEDYHEPLDSLIGRLSVKCRYPSEISDYPTSGMYFDITIAASRPASAIAKDIQRRFLPRYEKNYTIVMERWAKEQESKRQQQDNITHLLRVGEPLGAYRSKGNDTTVLFKVGEDYGYIDVSSTICQLKVTLPPSLMEKVLVFLSENSST